MDKQAIVLSASFTVRRSHRSQLLYRSVHGVLVHALRIRKDRMTHLNAKLHFAII